MVGFLKRGRCRDDKAQAEPTRKNQPFLVVLEEKFIFLLLFIYYIGQLNEKTLVFLTIEKAYVSRLTGEKHMYNTRIIRTKTYVEIYQFKKPVLGGEKPFDNGDDEIDWTVKSNKDFDDLTSIEKKEKLRKLKKHRQDAKWRLLRLIDVNFDEKSSFITLTTKENIRDRKSFNKLFEKFIKRYNYTIFGTKKAKLKYVVVLEKQKRGAWHAHCLMFSVPYVPHKNLLNLWRHGGVRINKLNKLDDVSNAGRYCVKYMSKGIGQELIESLGKKSYFRSKNLKIPEEEKLYLQDPLKFNSKLIVYETEYSSKIFIDHQYVNNPVHYVKILNSDFEKVKI